MCGISGVVGLGRPGEEETVAAMTATLAHRGPNDDGFHAASGVALGMRRLSIIDVEGGRQPALNEDGSVVVMMNGEIYNYVELRSELAERGHRFRTQSDTEVVAHLYEEHGPRFLERLVGMFAIALWDAGARRLLLARDRLGEKPLYYTGDARRLAFASELKALLADETTPRALDPGIAAEFLRYMYVSGDRTPFAGVKRLLPGHLLTVDESGLSLRPFWTRSAFVPDPGMSLREAVDGTRRRLEEAVALQLRSDVPLGAFLSGGLDSSSIVAIAARLSERPIETFSVGFGPGSFDELRYARIVAEAFGTRHHETVVDARDAIEHLPLLVWHLDEPNGDSAVVPTYLVSRFAAPRVRVVLTGVGGDELFGGYSRYFDGRPLEHAYRRIPRPARRLARPVLARLAPSLADRLAWNELGPAERYDEQTAFLAPAQAQRLAAGAPARTDPGTGPARDEQDRRMVLDQLTYLPDDLLHLNDRMTMAASIEGRAPLLDHRLAEWSAAMPARHKMRVAPRRWKIALHRAMEGVLPEPILRRPKWGFGPPVDRWMQGGLLDAARDVLARSSAARAGLLRQDHVDALLAGAPGRAGDAQRVWNLLVLETWARVYVDGKGRRPDYTLEKLRT
ncbi:MAG TPA: asparagine synthase (glutamine-hydrolyzing) [Candidatus Thermoplasmatota archaeon]|nr:asparagine synthase (glutamine-hydrolyzing) [Candidatus Thermoplasmatota archaeon]